MILDVLAQILDDAVEYGMLAVNPARGRRRRMKVAKPARGFLEPDMVVDLLDAAGDWEREVPPHQRYGRRAVLALLCLAGPRISEVVLADRRDVDLASGSYWIPEAKTDAGERTVDLTAACAEELRAHAAAKSLDPDGPMFPTSTGGRLNASNLRNRLLINEPPDQDGLRYTSKTIKGERVRVVRSPSAVERANDKRAAEGKIPLPKKVTPHTLRRTYASLCFFAGRDPRYVMSQIGHADARLTLQVYAQCMERRRVDYDLVWSLMRFGDEPENRLFGPTNGPTRFQIPSEAPARIGR
jgi:integrase